MSSIGIVNSIPWIVNLPGQGGSIPTPPSGNFVALESDINDIALLEDGSKIELE
tara:strand:+ start:6672 stop:6833 length:162 start_codon:yes stop_codon:yes gene_type:complete